MFRTRRGITWTSAAWLATVVLAIILCGPLFSLLRGAGFEWRNTVTEDFNYGRVEVRDGLVAVEGFASNQDGWYLLPGSHGRLIYRIPRTPDARMVAAIIPDGGGGGGELSR